MSRNFFALTRTLKPDPENRAAMRGALARLQTLVIWCVLTDD